MGFEVIGFKKPSYALGAAIAIIIIAILILCLSILFFYLFITGKGTNFLYGTILSTEFLLAGITLVLYLKYFVGIREVSEDRKEELLW